MGDSIPCSICGKPANIHLTQIVDDHVAKLHVCEECAARKDLFKGTLSPVAHAIEALKPMLEKTMTEDGGGDPRNTMGIPGDACPDCGFSSADFLKTHRLGCPECYKFFAKPLASLLDNIQPGATHCGRFPGGKVLQGSLRDALDSARNKMGAAIKAEAYEDAAILRDEIQKIMALIPGPDR